MAILVKYPILVRMLRKHFFYHTNYHSVLKKVYKFWIVIGSRNKINLPILNLRTTASNEKNKHDKSKVSVCFSHAQSVR